MTSHVHRSWRPARQWLRLFCLSAATLPSAKRHALCAGLLLSLATVGAKQRSLIWGKDSSADLEVGAFVEGLPTFSAADVATRNGQQGHIWVIYRNGVYDITDFIQKHPGGGEKVMLAAGGYIEPFWQYYQQHQKSSTKGMLEQYRVGNLRSEDVMPEGSLRDPYTDQPVRAAHLKLLTEKPFNAESPLPLLGESFITPNDTFYIRNHMPVPEMDIDEYRLEVDGLGVERPLTLTLDQLKEQFPRHCTTVTISCSGNRRQDMEAYKHVKGLDWGPGAISTAQWCGAKLVDVLHAAAFEVAKGAQHMQFDGLDNDVEGNNYNVSIPIATAISPTHEVLLAYEMNGEPIPADHGYPVRAVVPGITGARSVKWLARVHASAEEAPGHFQQKDYKVWASSVNFGDVPPQDAPAIQEMPIQSAICSPTPATPLPQGATAVPMRGYAYSGGGRDIARVEVSSDGGQHWQTAQLLPRELPEDSKGGFRPYQWSWVLWEANVPIDHNTQEVDLCCRAVDFSYNVQPESPATIWNMRGLLTNSWHHVRLRRSSEAVPEPSQLSTMGTSPSAAPTNYKFVPCAGL